MAREHNFLLGQGEKLANKVKIAKASGPKNPPYSFETARKRVSAQLTRTIHALDQIPDEACPRNEAVAVMTLHPRYVSKSDFPSKLLSTFGLRSVGSKGHVVRPEAWGVSDHPEEAPSEDIFVAGSRSSFKLWHDTLGDWTSSSVGASDLTVIEDLSAFDPKRKIKLADHANTALLEVVLHNSLSSHIVPAFFEYAKRHDSNPLVARRRDIEGLTFIPVEASREGAQRLAEYAFVRVVRSMPVLRPLRPGVLRAAGVQSVLLPNSPALDTGTRAVIFDGGIPASAISSLSQWVSHIDAPGVGSPDGYLQDHGLAVTSAFLFGPLYGGSPAATPPCNVTHVRVLDAATGSNNDLHYYDALDRIRNYLESHVGDYSFVNISLGPQMAMEDDDVTLWTSTIDQQFAKESVLATVAVGNDGERDRALGLNRVQPPSDAVNVLSVGASDVRGANWKRADYSCIGPGRCPGLVKPDVVTFGGSDLEFFHVLDRRLAESETEGTSFAAPTALRTAASVRAHVGSRLSALCIRALLIHRAESHSSESMSDVGWGRLEPDAGMLITCEDDEATVVYQDTLPVGEHLRAWIPLPPAPLTGSVEITATLVIAPEVDPQDSAAYTRSGLEVAFRPDTTKFTQSKGKTSTQPKSQSFFSQANLYGQPEFVLREDGHKWEPCLRSSVTKRAQSLNRPCFDIYYHSRSGRKAHRDPQPIPFALVVTVKAPKVPDLYNQVVRAYAQTLLPIRPKIAIQLPTR